MTYTIDILRKNKLIILEARMGSHAYGTSTPESDIDIRGVFVQPLDDILKYGFVNQVSDEKKDIIFYELGRFIHLLIENSPAIIELLGVPEDCVIYKDPIFNTIESYKKYFLSKKLRWSFAGYAIDQIQKAKGYNKKINWEASEMIRKTVLDFCYVLVDGGTLLFKKWLDDWSRKNYGGNITQDMFGLANMEHAHNLYSLYFLSSLYNFALFDEKKYGIVSDENKANDVQLTSIPKGLFPVSYLYFNKDGYTSHCKKFKEYQEWIKNRNPNRFKMNKEHGKNYDSKNMMHTYRLLLMAHELSRGELRIRRTPEEIEKLMKIRRGEYEYDDLLREAEAMKDGLDEAYEISNLPEKPNEEIGKELLYTLRKNIYKL